MTRYIPEFALLAALLAILVIAGLVGVDQDAEHRRLLDLDPVEAMR